MLITVTLKVNGKNRKITTESQRSLLEVLREELDLYGVKYGCGEGQCGACTVLLEGKPVRSCVLPVAAVKNKSITTIEGLSTNGKLHPVQQAFLDEGAMQCGFCTPGMVLGAAALLEEHPRPTDEQIIEAMNGHICRCNGYTKIMAAIRRAAGAGSEVK